MLKEVLPKIWTWEWFSEPKGYFFNGTAILGAEKKILIDPVMLSDEKEIYLSKLGPFDAIYLTNKDHERIAFDLRRKWNIPVGIHELDAKALKEKPDFTFSDGEELDCGIRVILLRAQKTPGECAFYLQSRSLLIVGDALLGVPKGSLSQLPAEKFEDRGKALQALTKLKDYAIDSLMVGDGSHLFDSAKDVLIHILDQVNPKEIALEKG